MTMSLCWFKQPWSEVHRSHNAVVSCRPSLASVIATGEHSTRQCNVTLRLERLLRLSRVACVVHPAPESALSATDGGACAHDKARQDALECIGDPRAVTRVHRSEYLNLAQEVFDLLLFLLSAARTTPLTFC